MYVLYIFKPVCRIIYLYGLQKVYLKFKQYTNFLKPNLVSLFYPKKQQFKCIIKNPNLIHSAKTMVVGKFLTRTVP